MGNSESIFLSPVGAGFTGPVRPVTKPPSDKKPQKKHPRRERTDDAECEEGTATLTPREWEIVALIIATAMKNKKLARALGVSYGTMKVYLSHILQKLGLENRGELALWWNSQLNGGESWKPTLKS